MNHYHNSTNQNETFVIKAANQCKNQEEQVLRVMQMFKQQTASDVWKVLGPTSHAPLTSIRRALSNLTYGGKLMKANKTKIGLYGKPEHYYTLIETTIRTTV